MPRITPNYGIDTSVFVRLLTGHPQVEFEATVDALFKLLTASPSIEVLVSNQVIGEAYIALQFHYKVSKSDARQALYSVLSAGTVTPLNGAPVLAILKEDGGCGLVDRLIEQDYAARGAMVLTNDRRMAKLPSARLLY